MKKLFLTLIALAIAVATPASSFALDIERLPSTTQSTCEKAIEKYPKYNYLITDYKTKIIVNENNVYNVTEDFNVCFAKNGSHGIYRDIPTSKDFWRANGDVTRNVRTQVTNIKVSGDDYTKSREDNNIRLKIGNANRTLRSGDSKQYTISYDYNFGPDKIDGVDEFYYNLIGSEWASDVIFLNTDFTIYFPKNIEEKKIGFTHGYKHDSLDGGTLFELKDNRIITGSYIDPLKGGEALTIRVTLPEGYIQNAAYETNMTGLKIFAGISAAVLIIIVAFYFIFGKDEKLPLYERQTPPDGMNPLQFGALVNASNSDNVTSLLYHLAEQGYLKIEEKDKKDFDIIFVKEYYGNDPAEREFINSLKKFDTGNTGRVNLKALKNHFYTKIPKIIRAAKINELKKKIYTKSGNTYQALSYTALVFYIILGFIFLISDPYADSDTAIILMTLACFIVPGSAIVMAGFRSLIKESNKASGLIVLIFGAFFSYLPLQLLIIVAPNIDGIQLSMMLILLVTSVIIIICAKNGKRYTEEGRKIMTDVLSYYNYIKSCRPDATHGFSYFYYTFAFAFAAGLSTAFSKRFKDVISQPPEWYSGNSTNFTHFSAGSFATTMNSISSSASSSPSSSGGGSGGGGSSGGGGGGGGGGGW